MGIELKDEARQHEEDLERIADFRLMDDDYMTAFFNEYPEGVELMLRIIMNKPQLMVKDVKTQNVLKICMAGPLRWMWMHPMRTAQNMM